MGQQTIPVLKEKFADGKTPPGSDFADLIDSYYHKSTPISQTKVLGLNEDFATKDELNKATVNFKGYHTDLSKLQTAYPQAQNKKDWFAWVGSPYPGTVYKVFADGGAWTDTGEVPTQQEIDLAEYLQKTDLQSEYSTSKNTAPTSYLLNKLYDELYGSNAGGEIPLTEVIPFSDDGDTWSVADAGHFYYINQDVIRNKPISKIKARFNSAGVFSVLIGKNVTTSQYTFTVAQTFNVVAGINELSVNISLSSDEWLGFVAPNDTALFKYNKQRTANPVGGAFRSGTSTNTGVGDLCIGVFVGYSDEQTLTETIPYTGLTARTSAAPFQFFYVNHGVLNRKNIAKVKINIVKAGTMSILFAKNVGSATNYSFTKQVFNVTTGVNEIIINRQLEFDETIGFFDFDDTATFTFGASGTINPVGGGMIHRSSSGAWASPNPQLDLSIGVFTGGTDIQVRGDVNKLNLRMNTLEDSLQDLGVDPTGLLRDKSFSVLGDSISTFQGMIPSGHAYFYPTGNVTSWLQTWWGLLTTNKYGMRLVANASYSGGTLTSGTGGTSIPDFVPKLGEKPDYIFLFMGTNDYTSKVAIGELSFYSFDRTKFIQAACDLVNKTLTAYPNSRIVLMSPLQRNPSTATNGKTPNKIADSDVNFLYDYKDAYERVAQIYGIQFVDMFKCGISFYNIDTYLLDKLHPNARGMEIIANYVYRNLAMFVER